MEDFAPIVNPFEAGPASGKKRARPRVPQSIYFGPSHTVRRMTKNWRKNPYKAVHKFKRTTASFGTITTDSINPVLGAYNFSFNDIPGYTELTSLFDFYKITGIRIRVMPFTQDGSESTASLNNSFNPPFYMCVDTSDGSAPVSVDAVLEYDTLKIGWLWKGLDFYFKPKFSDATAAQRSGWTATTSAANDWYGVKFAVPPTGGSAAKSTVLVTFYVSCKNVK